MTDRQIRWNPLDWTPGVAWDTRYALPPIQPAEAHAIAERCGPILCDVEGCDCRSRGYAEAAEMYLCQYHMGVWLGNRPQRARRIYE